MFILCSYYELHNSMNPYRTAGVYIVRTIRSQNRSKAVSSSSFLLQNQLEKHHLKTAISKSERSSSPNFGTAFRTIFVLQNPLNRKSGRLGSLSSSSGCGRTANSSRFLPTSFIKGGDPLLIRTKLLLLSQPQR